MYHIFFVHSSFDERLGCSPVWPVWGACILLNCSFLRSYGWRRQWHPTPVLLPGKDHMVILLVFWRTSIVIFLVSQEFWELQGGWIILSSGQCGQHPCSPDPRIWWGSAPGGANLGLTEPGLTLLCGGQGLTSDLRAFLSLGRAAGQEMVSSVWGPPSWTLEQEGCCQLSDFLAFSCLIPTEPAAKRQGAWWSLPGKCKLVVPLVYTAGPASQDGTI